MATLTIGPRTGTTSLAAAWRRRRRQRRALAKAWQAFRACSSAWWDALFDAQMLRRPQAAEALAQRDPVALARAWTAQFHYADPRRRDRDVRRMSEVAELFLGLLAKAEAEEGLAAPQA